MSRGWQFGKANIRRSRARRAARERASERADLARSSIRGKCVKCHEEFDYVPSGPGLVRLYCSPQCLGNIGLTEVLKDERQVEREAEKLASQMDFLSD